eukprot:354691-Chlamydomonas_euryale.AAC.3
MGWWPPRSGGSTSGPQETLKSRNMCIAADCLLQMEQPRAPTRSVWSGGKRDALLRVHGGAPWDLLMPHFSRDGGAPVMPRGLWRCRDAEPTDASAPARTTADSTDIVAERALGRAAARSPSQRLN